MTELGDFDFKQFRSLFRRTFWDWVKSLFRERMEFEPCRIFHFYQFVYSNPYHVYEQCIDCMERKYYDNPRCQSGRPERINTEWLEYKELEFIPKYKGFGMVVWS